MPTDYAQTSHAQQNRRKKAEALALRAAEFGFQPYELTMPVAFGTLADHERRERVRKDLGLKTRPSDETWTMALDILEGGTRGRPGAKPCNDCGWAVVPVKSRRGTPILLDPWSHPDGTVYLTAEDAQTYAVVVTGTDTPPDGVPLFRQHASSCPESRQAAQRRRREAPRCVSCGEPRDGYLALTLPWMTAHPTCPGGGEPPCPTTSSAQRATSPSTP